MKRLLYCNFDQALRQDLKDFRNFQIDWVLVSIGALVSAVLRVLKCVSTCILYYHDFYSKFSYLCNTIRLCPDLIEVR
jgi:hypothetical protein